MKKEIGAECRHVHYATSFENPDDDLVVIKEIVHYDDGSTEPRLRPIENYKIPFWIVQKGYRTYKEKKESEDIKKCIKFETNAARLPMAINRALGKPVSGRMYIKDVLNDPYVYGADVKPSVWLKHQYEQRYPDLKTKPTVAAYDVEFDIVNKELGKNNGIILASYCQKNIGKTYLFINRKFINDTPENIQRLDDTFRIYAGEEMAEHGYDRITYIFADSSAELADFLLQKAHEIKPDFMSAWNHHYDITTIIRELDNAGYDVGDVFNDPSIPNKYRKFRFVEGNRIRVTAAGKNMNLGFQELWHSVYASMHFQFVDAMSTYYHVRKAKGQMASYSLNDILLKEIGVGKMSFDKVKATDAETWHIRMQTEYPFEYAVYCWYDSHRMNVLEAKTNDIAVTVPALLGLSDLDKFPKLPSMLADKFTFVCLENGEVPASTGNEMESELDQHLPSIKGWIVTLDTQNVEPSLGIAVFRDLPNLKSLVYIHVADLDCVSTYPTTESEANMSKKTTRFEVCRMKDMPFGSFRYNVINFTGGAVNALNIMQQICNFPTHDQMFAIYQGENVNYDNAIKVSVRKYNDDDGLVGEEDDEFESEDDDTDDDDDSSEE